MAVPALSPGPALRPWLSVFLPFTALGLLPWWLCAAQVLALTLTRLSDESRAVSYLLVVLGATGAALTQWPNLYLTGNLWAFGMALGTGALLSLGLLEGGRWTGLLPGLVVLLVAPTPAGLGALLLAALALDGRDGRAHRPLGRPAALLGVVGMVLGTALVALTLGLLLPTSSPAQVSPPAVTRPAAPVPPAVIQPPAPGTPGPLRPRTRAAFQLNSGALFETLTPLAGLLLVVCIWLTLRRAQSRRLVEGKSNWSDYVAVAGSLALLVMLLILGLGVRGGGAGGGTLSSFGSGPASALTPDQVLRSEPDLIGTGLLNGLAVLAVLLFGGMAVWLWLLQRQPRALSTDPTVELGGSATLLPIAAPLHRVRLAWQRAEGELMQAGLGRGASETPQEATRRWAQVLPKAATELTTLSALYQPVRYGGVISEAEAGEAEQVAEQIIQSLHAHSSEATHD